MPDHRLDPQTPIRIHDLPTKGKAFCDNRKRAESEFRDLRDELIQWQPKLYADDRQQLLIVFQAMDAGGKDGTIRRVFRGVNPQGVRVNSFKAPSQKELARDFLWRAHRVVPARGMIGVFNRSHYEDVLVVRVEKLVPEKVWRPRYDHINHFEKLLVDAGTTILKFFLHISPDEQKERFQDRLDHREKHWKFSLHDLDKRKKWHDYMVAYEEMLNRCTTDHAPWYVIPSDQKWYRNLAVTRTIVETLHKMNPDYPTQEEDLSRVVIE